MRGKAGGHRLGLDLDRTIDSGGRRRLGFIIICGTFRFLSQEPAAVVNALSKQEIHLAAESKCYISIYNSRQRNKGETDKSQPNNPLKGFSTYR